jgi:hypothetical protein
MSKVFIVLGMHRSGTSLIARGLHSEIHMGTELIIANNDTQPRGYYESKALHTLNADILEAAGGDRKGLVTIPSEAAIMEQQGAFEDRIKAVLEQERDNNEVWGWKDPKTTLTIRVLEPYLSKPHFICMVRNGDEVVDSFRRRDVPRGRPFSPDLVRKVTDVYNSRMLVFMQEWLVKTNGLTESI